eukprot:TRINITY_DN63290_c0_g1_i2.p1 TRINITY_DN63290_c0_g1~~TRINITY_DN63290_c0_g1_i2.p1  ORF type:complete len:137 (+),score=31.35 TRINITY_DN63290_c0_g1_i2:249-659(+)
MASHGKAKRTRARDFSGEEIDAIRQQFVKHHDILSAKHSTEITQKRKDAVYKSIVGEVNALGVAERSLSSVKDKWQAMKKTVKEKVGVRMKELKKERAKTGGGENPTLEEPDVLDSLTNDEKEILTCIPPEQILGE